MHGVSFLLSTFRFRYSRSLQDNSLLTFDNSSSVILIIIVHKSSLLRPHIMGKNLFKSILLILIGSMSSPTRQRFPLYQVQCRAQIDIWFYSVLCRFFPPLSSYHMMAAFEIWILGTLWKINLDQTLGIYDNNLESTLNISYLPRVSFSVLNFLRVSQQIFILIAFNLCSYCY